ncbi:MAG: DUF4349 domain-containing protein [Nocardioides sp.]
MNGTSHRLPSLALTALLAAGVGLAGCASGGGSDESAGPTSAEAPAEDAPLAQAENQDGVADSDVAQDRLAYADRSTASALRANLAAADDTSATQPGQPAIISVGTITLQSKDVAGARFDLEKVVDSYSGTIADEKTTASTDGEVRLSRVVLRIPSEDFDAAMLDLAELGKVTASTRKAEDVTAQVIDTQARIRAQEQSLERVEVLFAQAQNIRDIVAIEAQLSRRQADLDSLKGQLAYLEDQTTLSTITVYLELAPDEPQATTPKPEDDDNAFVAGLKNGWDALSEVGAGLATVSGALLPFAVVALVLGVPALLFGRRVLARHPLRRPTVEA